MKRNNLIAFVLVAILLLSACGEEKEAASAASQDSTAAEDVTVSETAADSEDTGSSAQESTGFVAAPVTAVADESARSSEDTYEIDPADLTADPPYDYDIDTMKASDFGDYFTTEYECRRETYTLLAGDSMENEVTVIYGSEPGPVIYVVAGVHGDEEAAWRAGNLLKNVSIKAGTLYVLSPANKQGSSLSPKKRTVSGKDMNRQFPGDPNGNDAQRLAWAIYSDIKDKSPDFVFDLHEAVIVEAGRDYLGSSLIYSSSELCASLVFDIVWASEDGEICNRAFDCYSPGPEGSINRTVTEKLNIPVVTVETFRGYQMEDRIHDQLEVVNYVLEYYGLV